MKRAINKAELTRRITQTESERIEQKWKTVITELENKVRRSAEQLKDYEAEQQKGVIVDRTKTPFCAALGHLYEKRNMVDAAIKLIEPMRNIYLLEQGKSL